MDIVAILLTLVLSGLGLPPFCIFVYRRMRKRGYPAPAVALVLLGGGALGIAAAVAGAVLLPIESGNIETFRYIFWYPLAASIFVTSSAAYVLPRRNPRVFGPRRPRFPFVVIGILLIALGWGVLLLAIVKGGAVGDAVKLTIIISAFGIPLIILGRRTRTSLSIEKVEETDPRAPVLYLRPFYQEGNAFVQGPKSRYGNYVTGLQSSLMTLGEYSFGGANDFKPDPDVSIRFEEYFSGRLTASIGPFVALGNPEDYTMPEGAVRSYSTDSDWKNYLERLARKASCIVAEVSSSENLKWEFEFLRRENLHQKLFIMTRPVAMKFRWYEAWLGHRRISWSDFAKTLGASGFQIPVDPGPGAVLKFDGAGRGIVLKTGAQTPEDYIEPIKTLLGIHAESGPQNLDPPALLEPNEPGPAAETPSSRVPETVVKRRGALGRLVTSNGFIVAAFFLIIILSLAAENFVKGRLEVHRAHALAEIAPKLGFTFIGEKVTITNADLARCDLLTGGKKTAVLDSMEGTVSGHPAALFDYRYDWESDDRSGGTTTHTEFQTVAAFASTGRKMPEFKLRDNTFGNRMNLTGLDRSAYVKFADSPEFADQFIVISNDKNGARALFAPCVRRFLLRSPHHNWHVDGAGPWLIFYHSSSRVDPKALSGFLQETAQLAIGLFQNCGGE